MDAAAQKGGMGFAQEMMVHDSQKVKTTRPSGNENVFRALCLDSINEMAIYESKEKIAFGDFIAALMSQNVKEALYTDMGYPWNYCFYRLNPSQATPTYLHNKPEPKASNFVVLRFK